jgi:hypothetical protein
VCYQNYQRCVLPFNIVMHMRAEGMPIFEGTVLLFDSSGKQKEWVIYKETRWKTGLPVMTYDSMRKRYLDQKDTRFRCLRKWISNRRLLKPLIKICQTYHGLVLPEGARNAVVCHRCRRYKMATDTIGDWFRWYLRRKLMRIVAVQMRFSYMTFGQALVYARTNFGIGPRWSQQNSMAWIYINSRFNQLHTGAYEIIT